MLYDSRGRPVIAIEATSIEIGSTAVAGATVGSILFVGVGNFLAEDNANLFYNDTDNQLQLGDGTLAIPSLTFKTDPDTGIFRQAINSIGFSTNSLERVRIDASGDLVITTNLRYLKWNGRSRITSQSDGNLVLTDSVGGAFSVLAFGGTSSSYPGLARNLLEIHCRLADNSNFAGFQAKRYQATVGTLTLASASIPDQRMFEGDVTWNNGTETYHAFDINVNSTSAAATSSRFRVRDPGSGISHLQVDRDGNTRLVGNLYLESNPAVLSFGASLDITLLRITAGILAQQDSTNPQEFRIYGTFTSSLVGEYLSIRHNGSASDIVFESEKGPIGGTIRNFLFTGNGIYLRLPLKSATGDPSGTNGALYYNSTDAVFRAYINGAWQNLLGNNYVGVTRVTSSPTTLNATHDNVFVDTDGGAITINLPAGVAGRRYRIMNTGTSLNNVTVNPNGAELLIGVNSSFTLLDGEDLIIAYESTEGWY